MLLVVGGHSRKVGKTAVAAGLIRSLLEAGWTAVKITQHAHGGAAVALERQTEPDPGADSGRYLAAGARQAWWLRYAPGRLGEAVPELRRILDTCENALVESNSVLEFFQPDLCLMVLDYSVRDFKASGHGLLERADALVIVESGAPPWPGIPTARPQFRVKPPEYTSAELVEFVRARLKAPTR